MLLEKAKKILRPIYGPAVDRWRQSHPRLEIDVEQFAGFRSPVRELLLKAAKARFYRHSEQVLFTRENDNFSMVSRAGCPDLLSKLGLGAAYRRPRLPTASRIRATENNFVPMTLR
jgi:hypothetical protein